MDSYLVMAYSYATTHSIVLHSTTGKVTHTRRNVSGPATQVGAAVGVIRIGATRVRHNPPSSAGQSSGGGPGVMAAKGAFPPPAALSESCWRCLIDSCVVATRMLLLRVGLCVSLGVALLFESVAPRVFAWCIE
jgi:hypothetical protein